MTHLSKPVYRRVAQRSGARELIVGIEPPGILTFREKGTRRRYSLGLGALFVRAVMEAVDRERAEKRKRGRVKS